MPVHFSVRFVDKETHVHKPEAQVWFILHAIYPYFTVPGRFPEASSDETHYPDPA